MKPTVGRIVHYYDREQASSPQAAIITEVFSDDVVNLTIFPSSKYTTWATSVLRVDSPKMAGGGASAYWCWPPRV